MNFLIAICGLLLTAIATWIAIAETLKDDPTQSPIMKSTSIIVMNDNHYHYGSKPMNWYQAEIHCQNEYGTN